MKLVGFFPSISSRCAHLPHRTVVIVGESSVVSILNIGLPASGIVESSGVHFLVRVSSSMESLGIERPNKSTTNPPRESVAARYNEKSDGLESIAPVPNAMQTQAETTMLILL